MKGIARQLPKVILLLLAAWDVQVFAADSTYYVTPDGRDSNSGTSPDAPWTLTKVNATTFGPGDRILFLRGAEWGAGAGKGAQLVIHGDGSAEKPIYFGSYLPSGGSETLGEPTIHAGGTKTSAILIPRSSYVTVEGFKVTNFDLNDIYDGAEALRNGIQTGEWNGNVPGPAQTQIRILNNEVAFIEGCSNHPDEKRGGPPRGSSLSQKTYNLYVNAAIFPYPSPINGLIVEGNYVHDCTCTGIHVWGHATPHTNVVVRNNIVQNVGGDGIVVDGVTSPLVEYNTCIKAGNNSGDSKIPRGPGGFIGENGLAVAGIWGHKCSDAIFQYNYCAETRKIVWDGQAWDFDIGMTGTCIFQYNVSRDNEGGFLLSVKNDAPGLKLICRYNISINDGSHQYPGGKDQGFFNGVSDHHNNIFYRTDGKPFAVANDVKGTFTNNIFFTTASSGWVYQGDNRTFLNNCFSGHDPAGIKGEGAIIADALFVDAIQASQGKPLTEMPGFKLLSSSPCRNAGRAMAENGGHDFWNQVIPPGSANIGADASVIGTK